MKSYRQIILYRYYSISLNKLNKCLEKKNLFVQKSARWHWKTNKKILEDSNFINSKIQIVTVADHPTFYIYDELPVYTVARVMNISRRNRVNRKARFYRTIADATDAADTNGIGAGGQTISFFCSTAYTPISKLYFSNMTMYTVANTHIYRTHLRI